MAKLTISSKNNLAISCSKKIRIYKTDSDEYQELELTAGKVTSLQFSPNGQYLAVASDDKLLHLWRQEEDQWTLLSSRKLIRKSPLLVFSQDHILVGDGTGYVTRFSVTEDPSAPGSTLLGHCSMLLDLALSEDGRYVITSDRDEKIRVSNYPESYDIHTYCLGHQEFVSNIATVPGHPSWLMSASGDETLRLWEFADGGKQKSCLQYAKDSEDRRLPPKHLVCTSHPLVLLFPDGDDACMVFGLEKDNELTLRSNNPLPSAAWDICLDPQDRLWVILDPGRIQVYQVLEDGKLEPADPSPHIHRIMEDSTVFLEGCEAPETVTYLYKRSYDNQTLYYERKKEREEKLAAKRIKLESAAIQSS